MKYKILNLQSLYKKLEVEHCSCLLSIEIRTSLAGISFVYKLWPKYLYKKKMFGCDYHIQVINSMFFWGK